MSTRPPNAKPSMLLVGTDDPLCEAVRSAAPAAAVDSAADVFEALAQTAEHGADVVLLPADLLGRRRGQILHAFRHAGPKSRLTLLCPPAGEPEAIQACREGADDYILTPIEAAELLDVLDAPNALTAEPVRPRETAARRAPRSPAALPILHELLAAAEGDLSGLLQKAADAVAGQVGARDAAVIVLNSAGEAESWAGTAALNASDVGEPVEHEIALAQALLDGDHPLGWLNLGPPRAGGTYPPATVEEVGQWGRILARLIAGSRQTANLRRLAVTDDLSGLYNRRYFDHFLRRIVQRAAEERFRVTAMIFDIDDFKHYNDRYGHMVGDAIIRDVAMLMRRCTRPHDVVARFGGDEFAVIFWDNEQPRQPNSEHPHDALAMAERFRDEMSRHAFAAIGPKAKGRLTISGGLASFPWDAKDPESLLGKADEALLAAKGGGKDRILLVGREPT